MSVLKNDAKGRVMKCIRLNGFRVQWCIIKEANHDVCADAEGRDVRDRLKWQYELQTDLQGKVRVPVVYEYFEMNGNTFLAMEYVRGKLFIDVVNEVFNVLPWQDLPVAKKLYLIKCMASVVDVIGTLHQNGYVHRDINPMNFILDKKNAAIPIDLELAYSVKRNRPVKPFLYRYIRFYV